MPSPEEGARQAIMDFYQALDALLLGRGTERMSEAWWHDDLAETVHPFGHWARGWSEVWATWQESAQVFSFYKGHAGRPEGIGGIRDLRLRVLGDVAVATSVYESTLYLPVGAVLLWLLGQAAVYGPARKAASVPPAVATRTA